VILQGAIDSERAQHHPVGEQVATRATHQERDQT
jgi:hypothetical protein